MRNDLVEVRSSVPVRKFVPVYHDMLRAKMTCEEKLIYIILKSFVSFGCEEGEVYPSMDTICAMSGMSRPRATRVINKLVKNGYVKKLRRGVTKPNLYTVADYPAMWEEKTTVEDRKEILDTEIPYKTDQLLDELVRRGVLTEEQLADFCEYIAGQIEKCGSSPEYPQGKVLADTARLSMNKLSEKYPSLRGYYPYPKQLTLLSRVFSSMGVSGIYSPFTVEANINGEMPGMEKPFTACHELSHLRGYMNEGEANYIGWLACIGSDNQSFNRSGWLIAWMHAGGANRSGWLIAWMHAGGALRRIDPERYERLRESLPSYAVSEIEENSLFWSSHETKASEVQDRVNDAYLKANDQKDGIQSYGMLTTLMLMNYYDQASPNQ